jgi:hypothetical protein
LVVTELPDPSLVPVDGGPARSSEQLLDDASARFGLAIAQALQADRRSLDEACKIRPAAGPGGTTDYDWQARCLYRRR